MPARSQLLFLAGVFFIFAPAGLLPDVSSLGGNSFSRLIASASFAGGIAVAYVVAVRRPRWLPAVIVLHLIVTLQFDRWFGVPGPGLSGTALRHRMSADVDAAIVSIIASFVLFANVLRFEGTRSARARTEIALARDIHRLLVPRVSKRINGFEFRGLSVPSGDVGGDLVDLVENSRGWTVFVVDVSGHGVGSGLLMGVIKSSARTELRHGGGLERLLNTLNSVVFELKDPRMFATFAGLQFDGGSHLQFAVAGHLPILHYSAATSTLAELTTPQVAVAMFDDRLFSASMVSCSPGDLLVIVTDGITEVFDGQDREFGFEQVKSIIRSNAREPLDVIEHRLMAAARSHGAQLDDQTLLLVRASADGVAGS
jgi:serine phosphatase RsbU (regulator of sigma subunit)